MGDAQSWMVLFRFGRREHLEQFRQFGLLHMMPHRYFAEIENDLARGDRFEGTDRIVQPGTLKNLTIESNHPPTKIVIKPEDLGGPLMISMGKLSCNVYCMFGVTQPSLRPLVDERNFDFGGSFVAVLDTQEFLDRICSAAVSRGLSCEWKRVDYYDPVAHTGETGPFRKPATFAHQNEFRFVVRPGSREAIRLEAGTSWISQRKFILCRRSIGL